MDTKHTPHWRRASPLSQSTTALYRHFGMDGELLYVGISLSAVQRLKQHKADKGWACEIASVHIEYYPTRDAALEAERNAIVKENPLFNKAYNRARSPLLYEPDFRIAGRRVVGRLFDDGIGVVGTLIEWDAGRQKRRGVVLRAKLFLGLPQVEVRLLRRNGTYGTTCVVTPESNPLVIDRSAIQHGADQKGIVA